MMCMDLIDKEICREYAATTAEKESLEAKDKFLHRKKVGASKMRWWSKRLREMPAKHQENNSFADKAVDPGVSAKWESGRQCGSRAP